MPTTLPERRPPEFSPSLRHMLALGAATLVMIALMAYHARFKAWVSEALRAEFVLPVKDLREYLLSPAADRVLAVNHTRR